MANFFIHKIKPDIIKCKYTRCLETYTVGIHLYNNSSHDFDQYTPLECRL